MLRDLNQIFPLGYPQTPTVEDLKFEVQDLLCHCETAATILQYLQQIKCPYYQEALTIQMQKSWHEMEQARKEPAVYLDVEGAWHYSWIDIDSALRQIIKKAHALQIDLESTEHEDTETPTPTIPKEPLERSTTSEPHIHHVDVMYSHCTIYQCTTPPLAPTIDELKQADAPTSLPSYPSFYRTNAQSITTIQKCFEQAMSFATKTKCIRFLLEHSRKDGCFDFSSMTNEERANALNQVQDKHQFKAGDFENANHASTKKH